MKFVRETGTKLRRSIITLVRNFTLHIGDKIPRDDKNWLKILWLNVLSSAYSKETEIVADKRIVP